MEENGRVKRDWLGVVGRVKRDWLGEWLGEWEKSKSVRYWKRIWVIEETKGKMKTNECVNTMSIGSLVVGLLAIDDENWFRVFEESRQGVYAYSNRT